MIVKEIELDEKRPFVFGSKTKFRITRFFLNPETRRFEVTAEQGMVVNNFAISLEEAQRIGLVNFDALKLYLEKIKQ